MCRWIVPMWIAALLFVAGAAASPIPNPNNVVTSVDEKVRITVLYDRVIRFEVAPFRPLAQASFVIIDRNTPNVAFNVTANTNTELQVATSEVTFTANLTALRDGSCESKTESHTNTDVVDPVRSPTHPHGLLVKSAEECCEICDSDSQCTASIFANDDSKQKMNCWPISSFSSLKSQVGRSVSVKQAVAKGAFSAKFALSSTETGDWMFGDEDTGNLGGTITSWNEVDPEKLQLQPGILSKDGWTVHDDTATPVFKVNSTTWQNRYPWMDASPVTPGADMYFFGCGRMYAECMSFFAGLSGSPPQPPLHAMGSMYSHYEAYSAEDVREILTNYSSLGMPISTYLLDVNWHPNQAEGKDKSICNGYNGYEFNTTLFPDPSGFIQGIHSGTPYGLPPLHLGVNTHGFIGVDSCNAKPECYDAVVQATGVPHGPLVPCNLSNPLQQEVVFSKCISAIGSDFIWLDGSIARWVGTGEAGPFNLWFNQYLHAHYRLAINKRPFTLSRYSGLGQQRFPMGFSGDASSTWSTLRAEAANVLFGTWSHDIGGFNKEDPTAEMFARWHQFGVFAPLDRVHGTRGSERRVWAPQYASTFEQMRSAIQLRTMLAPHLYTLYYVARTTARSALVPLYWEAPFEDDAYVDDLTYMYGMDMVVRPVTNTMEDLPHVRIWLPPHPGNWIEFAPSSKEFPSSTWLNYSTSIDAIPVFVKHGSIIPMLPHGAMDASGLVTNATDVMWTVFCNNDQGSCNAGGQLYEDDGTSLDYEENSMVTIVNATLEFGEAQHFVFSTSHISGEHSTNKPRSHRIVFRTSAGKQFGSPSSVTFNHSVTLHEESDLWLPGYRYTVTSDPAVPEGTFVVTTPKITPSSYVFVEIMF